MSQKFVTSDSSTFENYEEVVELEYGKGSATGVLCEDIAYLAGKSIGTQEFILVNRDLDMDGMKADGIMGMAFEELSRGSKPVVKTMADNGIIENTSFSVYIGDCDFSENNEKIRSNVIFGGHDLKKYSIDKSFIYIDIIKTGHWSIPLNQIKINKSTILDKAILAILDTGTSLILGPTYEITKIFEEIKKILVCTLDNLLICSCSNINKLPVIELILDGHSFKLTPEDYVSKEMNDCIILISEAHSGVWLLGDVFLRKYYTFYDMDNFRVGIARSKRAPKLRQRPSLFITIAFVLLIGFTLGVIGYLMKKYYLKRKRRLVKRSREIDDIPLSTFS